MVAAVGEGYCFLIDGISYIAVIAGLLAMRLAKDERPRSEKHVWHELVEGWKYVTRSAPIRTILIFLAVIGMGQVFRARDTKLDRDVAIKILPEAFAHDAAQPRAIHARSEDPCLTAEPSQHRGRLRARRKRAA